MLNERCSAISRLCLSREISEMCVFANTQTGVGLRAGYLYERMRHCLGHALRTCRRAHTHTCTRAHVLRQKADTKKPRILSDAGLVVDGVG